jgi:hypothetical protein
MHTKERTYDQSGEYFQPESVHRCRTFTPVKTTATLVPRLRVITHIKVIIETAAIAVT